FMGSPPMNLVPATFSTRGGVGVVRFSGGEELRLPHSPDALVTRFFEGPGAPLPLLVGIRPEAFQPAGGSAVMRVTVQAAEHAGADSFTSFTIGGTPVTARLPGRMQIVPGRSLALELDLETLSYFDPESGLRIG